MAKCLYIATWDCQFLDQDELTVEGCELCMKARKTKAEIDLLLAETNIAESTTSPLQVEEPEEPEETEE